MCQFEMLFALLTYLFLSVKKQKEVLLFPNFQRSFAPSLRSELHSSLGLLQPVFLNGLQR
jgi:hypothetical protein